MKIHTVIAAEGVLPEREAISSPALSALLLISEEIASTAFAHYTALVSQLHGGWLEYGIE